MKRIKSETVPINSILKINVLASEDTREGQFVYVRKRTWKERLFTLPWRPLQKYVIPKTAMNTVNEISKIEGVKYITVLDNTVRENHRRFR